jgi:hypothetical protein
MYRSRTVGCAHLPTSRRQDATSWRDMPEHASARSPRRTLDCAAPLRTPHHPTDFILRFPKPGVGCSIQPGGTTKFLHMAISSRAVLPALAQIGRNADILPTRRAATLGYRPTWTAVVSARPTGHRDPQLSVEGRCYVAASDAHRHVLDETRIVSAERNDAHAGDGPPRSAYAGSAGIPVR